MRNPMNPRQIRKISLAPQDVDCFVFWTKNPAPMLDRLHLLKNYHYYFQFTLTPYGKNIEPHLPPKGELIDTFIHLSGIIGKEKMIWRYDPILLSVHITVDHHIDHLRTMAARLAGHTEKCVISFIDMYRHIENRMSGLEVRRPDETQMRTLARNIVQIAESFGIAVDTCAEKIDLSDLGIKHGKCIDDRLVSERRDKTRIVAKDRYQRKLCGCVTSADIGEYDTCGHLCRYCYANVSQKKIEKKRLLHNPRSPLLIG